MSSNHNDKQQQQTTTKATTVKTATSRKFFKARCSGAGYVQPASVLKEGPLGDHLPANSESKDITDRDNLKLIAVNTKECQEQGLYPAHVGWLSW